MITRQVNRAYKYYLSIVPKHYVEQRVKDFNTFRAVVAFFYLTREEAKTLSQFILEGREIKSPKQIQAEERKEIERGIVK